MNKKEKFSTSKNNKMQKRIEKNKKSTQCKSNKYWYKIFYIIKGICSSLRRSEEIRIPLKTTISRSKEINARIGERA